MSEEAQQATQAADEEPTGIDLEIKGLMLDLGESEGNAEVSDNSEVAQEQEAAPEKAEVSDQEGESKDDPPGTLTKQQEKYLAKQRWKRGEAERKAQALEAELQQTRAQLAELQKEPEPQIPPIPDRFDDDYETKLKQRDEAVQAKAGYELRQRQLQEQAEQQAREQAIQAQQAQAQKAQEYEEKVKQSGLDEKAVEAAMYAVRDMNLPPHVVQALIADQESPKLMKFLADNPHEANELYGADPYHAALKVGTELREKAVRSLTPKQTQAPPPPQQLDGGGKASFEEPWMAGVVIE